MISKDHLRHLASLTWLTLTSEEEERYRTEFEWILGMIKQLESIDIPDEYSPDSIQTNASRQIMEADTLPTWVTSFENVDQMLEQVPLPLHKRRITITTSTNA